MTAALSACDARTDQARAEPRAEPRAKTLADAARLNSRFTWDSIASTTYTMYVPRGSYAATHATEYRAELEEGIAHALQLLGEDAYPSRLQLFFMRSREDVEAVTGTGWNGWTDAANSSAAVVAREECRPVIRHEVMHAVSLRLWGHPLGRDGDPNPPADSAAMAQGGWLREGIAAAAEGRYLSYSYRGMAAQWLAEGAILPFDTLVHRFYQVDDLAAYLQAGSLVQYLLEQYDRESFRMLWREGARAINRAYGKPASQIESEWHAWLRATPAAERPISIARATTEDVCPKRQP